MESVWMNSVMRTAIVRKAAYVVGNCVYCLNPASPMMSVHHGSGVLTGIVKPYLVAVAIKTVRKMRSVSTVAVHLWLSVMMQLIVLMEKIVLQVDVYPAYAVGLLTVMWVKSVRQVSVLIHRQLRLLVW